MTLLPDDNTINIAAGSKGIYPSSQINSVQSESTGGAGRITLIPAGAITIDGGTDAVTASEFTISSPEDTNTTYTIRANSAGMLELVDNDDSVVSTVSFAGSGPVVIDRDSSGNIEISVQVAANTGNSPTVALDTLQVGSTTYRVGGSTPAHARLRTSLTLNHNSVQLPRTDPLALLITASASIENPIAGDVINDVIIHSAHASYADGRTGAPVVISDSSSAFAWSYQSGDTAQVVTFTVSYSVSGIIDGELERSVHNETINFNIIAEPQHYWTGAITAGDLTSLMSSLSDSTIGNIPRLTQRDNFSSPDSITYNGGAVGSTPSLYAAIVVPQAVLITSLRAEGFYVSITSHNDSTAGRTLYVSEAFLSEGPHNLTWRA